MFRQALLHLRGFLLILHQSQYPPPLSMDGSYLEGLITLLLTWKSFTWTESIRTSGERLSFVNWVHTSVWGTVPVSDPMMLHTVSHAEWMMWNLTDLQKVFPLYGCGNRFQRTCSVVFGLFLCILMNVSIVQKRPLLLFFFKSRGTFLFLYHRSFHILLLIDSWELAPDSKIRFKRLIAAIGTYACGICLLLVPFHLRF